MTAVAAPTDEEASEAAARVRAGRAMRRLGHSFVGHHAPAELIDEMAGSLERFADRFDACDGPRRRQPFTFESRDRPEVADGDADGHL